MNLKHALRAGCLDRIAFTGSGGKTTSIFALAHAYLTAGCTPFVTTTTHLGVDQIGLGGRHIPVEGIEDLGGLEDAAGEIVVVTGPGVEDGRVAGLPGPVLGALADRLVERGCPLLIEADGARRKPLKAPAEHEPLVPGFVDAVVVVAGMSGLGCRLDEEFVHRPEIFGRLAGLGPGASITPGALVRVLAHPDGGLKGIPPGARRIALLNQADTPQRQAQAGTIAAGLVADYDAVLVAESAAGVVHAVREPVAAIVLAAGASTRMGQPKQLLEWKGQPLVAHAAGIALAAGCDPVIVVTGAVREQVRAAVRALPVVEVYNPDWESGQSTSVQAGLRAAAAGRAGSALFLLVDQPLVQPALLRLLMETHAGSRAPIVAPLIDAQRGNPVLFDRATFPAFETLRGDSGGRRLFSRFKAVWVPWHDALALRDIDTLEDYEDLRN